MTENNNNEPTLNDYFDNMQELARHVLDKLDEETNPQTRNILKFQILMNLSSLQSATIEIFENMYEKLQEDAYKNQSLMNIARQQEQIINAYESKYGEINIPHKNKIELSDDDLLEVSKQLIDKLFNEDNKGAK